MTTTPIMLAPILRATDGKPCPLTWDDVVAHIRATAANAKLVMPPLAAKDLAERLNSVADTAEGGGQLAWVVVNSWLDRIDEINAYAARAATFVEAEVFWDGTDPTDAGFTMSADTVEDALAWGGDWAPDVGAAHRTTIRIHGPWVIDRPARKETAA